MNDEHTDDEVVPQPATDMIRVALFRHIGMAMEYRGLDDVSNYMAWTGCPENEAVDAIQRVMDMPLDPEWDIEALAVILGELGFTFTVSSILQEQVPPDPDTVTPLSGITVQDLIDSPDPVIGSMMSGLSPLHLDRFGYDVMEAFEDDEQTLFIRDVVRIGLPFIHAVLDNPWPLGDLDGPFNPDNPERAQDSDARNFMIRATVTTNFYVRILEGFLASMWDTIGELGGDTSKITASLEYVDDSIIEGIVRSIKGE